jgi:hypothetical protein
MSDHITVTSGYVYAENGGAVTDVILGTAGGFEVTGPLPHVGPGGSAGMAVFSGATADQVNIYGSGYESVYAGGVSGHITVYTGGGLEVGYGGSTGAAGSVHDVVLQGGDVVVHGDGSSINNVVIEAGHLELEHFANLQSSIVFAPLPAPTPTPGGIFAVLQIDDPITGQGAVHFSHTVSGLAVGDAIDLTGLTFSSGTTTVTLVNTQLTVTTGPDSETITVANVTAPNFFVQDDGQGGTLVTTIEPKSAPLVGVQQDDGHTHPT